MKKTVFLVFQLAPFLWSTLYFFILLEYKDLFDRNLNYVRPEILSAPEDVLGFGFWPTWIVITIPYLLICFVSCNVQTKLNWYYWSVNIGFFLLLSTLDYYLFKALYHQVVG